MPHKRPAQPWDAFLHAINKTLVQPVELRCISGFAIATLYGLPRPTVDIDYLTVVPTSEAANLEALAGKGSALQSAGARLGIACGIEGSCGALAVGWRAA